MTAVPIPEEKRDDLILAVLLACRGAHNGKSAPTVIALPQLQHFDASEQTLKNVIYALEGIGLLAKNGRTNTSYYATTKRGGRFAQELLEKRGITAEQFWASLEV